MHEQIRQARRDRRALRSSSAALLKGPVRMLQRRVQPPFHIEQHPAAVGNRLHRFDDQVPRHLVEGRHDTLPTSMVSRRRCGFCGRDTRGRAARLS